MRIETQRGSLRTAAAVLLGVMTASTTLAAPPIKAPTVRLETARDAGSALVEVDFAMYQADTFLPTSRLVRETRTEGTGLELPFALQSVQACGIDPTQAPTDSRHYLLLRVPYLGGAQALEAQLAQGTKTRALELGCRFEAGERQCVAQIDDVEPCSEFRVEGVARRTDNANVPFVVRHALSPGRGPTFESARAGFTLSTRRFLGSDVNRRTLEATWAEPAMRAGETWVGFLELSYPYPGFPATLVPFEFVATSPLAREPRVFGPANLAEVVVDGGETLDRIVLDVPSGARRALLRVTATSEFHPFSIYFAPAPGGGSAGPDVGFAPSAASAPVAITYTEPPSAGDVAVVEAPLLTPGRWFLTIANPDPRPLTLRLAPTLELDDQRDIADGVYANPARPGHGVLISRGTSGRVVLWFAYDEAYLPTWYLGQEISIGAGGNRNAWAVSLRRYVFSDRYGEDVGYAVLTDAGQGALTYSWFVGGATGSETLVPLARCTPGTGRSGTWLASVSPGSGFSVIDAGSTDVTIAFVYGDRGQPRWLYAQGPRSASELPLQLFRGFCLTCADAAATSVNIGTLSRDFREDGTGIVNARGAFLGTPFVGVRYDGPVQRLTRPLDCRQ